MIAPIIAALLDAESCWTKTAQRSQWLNYLKNTLNKYFWKGGVREKIENWTRKRQARRTIADEADLIHRAQPAGRTIWSTMSSRIPTIKHVGGTGFREKKQIPTAMRTAMEHVHTTITKEKAKRTNTNERPRAACVWPSLEEEAG